MEESLTWATGVRKVADLKHWDKNPRKIGADEFAKLKERILARGFHDVIKIDTENVILSGNMRKDALEALGVEEVNVLVPSRALTTEEKVVIALESNRNDGEDDGEKLLELGIENLFEAGYDENELSTIFGDMDTENDEGFNEKKAIEEAEKKPEVSKGEMYQMGDHRLLIGDSTNPDDVAKLMNGELADTIYCDPPYNIGLDYSKGVSTGGKYQGVAKADLDDSKTDMGYTEFIEATIKNAVEHVNKNAHVFYWCDERYIWIMQTIFPLYGIANKRVCLWIKNNGTPNPGTFIKSYEPCVYGVIGRPYLNPNIRNLNGIFNKEVTTGNEVHEEIQDIFNVWMVKRGDTTEYEHPTQKPITLHEKPLKRCTHPGQIVLDLFGGSGSTLMACEQMKRKSRLMETNPIFAQVIIKRWEAYTKKKAEKI